MSDPKTPPQTTQLQQAPAPVGGQKLMTELKVSGHLMSFDAGLFCIFSAPGSAAPDPATGLPGVRLSLPPGPAFHPEAVTISTFRDDGWLGGWNGAALVRVARGPAQVMVTIYQAPNSAAEAPRLQIMRLQDATGAGQPPQAAPGQAAQRPQAAVAAPAPQIPAPSAQPAAPPATAASIALPQDTPAAAGAKPPALDAAHAEIAAHIQGRGDVLSRLGEWMGEAGSKLWVEGFALSPKQTIGTADIEYQAVLGRGWLSPWAEGGQFCGSRGMSLPILGLRVRLRGHAAETFDCALTATFVDGTKIGPLDNGEPCQAESLAPLEAFHIEIRSRRDAVEEAPPAAVKPRKAPAAKAAKPPAELPKAIPKRRKT